MFFFGTYPFLSGLFFSKKVNFAKSSLHFKKKLRNFAQNLS